MQISSPVAAPVRNEQDILFSLPLAGARALELGCGTADKTLVLAPKLATMLALEVDERQHAKNLARAVPANVKFALGGAQEIPAADNSVDLIFLFKSLHHVPLELLDQAFAEMRRVLVPGGLVYICEPVFAGEYNDIIRMFHDEEHVRAEAFAATCRAVQSGQFTLDQQLFFTMQIRYADFAGFEDKMLNATHTEHRLSDALYAAVRDKFNQHVTPEGAQFHAPYRIDLLRKPA